MLPYENDSLVEEHLLIGSHQKREKPNSYGVSDSFLFPSQYTHCFPTIKIQKTELFVLRTVR